MYLNLSEQDIGNKKNLKKNPEVYASFENALPKDWSQILSNNLTFYSSSTMSMSKLKKTSLDVSMPKLPSPRPTWVKEPDNSGNFHSVKDPETIAETIIWNAMFYSTIDNKEWGKIRRLCKDNLPYFQNYPVPAESVSWGLQMDKKWQIFITGGCVWNAETHGKSFSCT